MRRELAPLVLRIFLAVFLVYFAQQKLLDSGRLEVYAETLTAAGIAAYAADVARLSTYLQAAAGVLIGLGVLTRTMAFLMVLHWFGTILLIYADQPFGTWLEPGALLAVSMFLMLNGPGRYALDRLWKRD